MDLGLICFGILSNLTKNCKYGILEICENQTEGHMLSSVAAFLGKSEAMVELEPPSNLAEPEVRKSLERVAPPRPRTAPVVEEGAWLTPYDSKLFVTHREHSNELLVTCLKISVQFKGGKVTVIGAKDVRLYTSVGLRFMDRAHTDFTLDFTAGITTLIWPGRDVCFFYGSKKEVTFVLDQTNRVVKVWAPDIGFDFVKGGNVHFCVLEPRPDFTIPERIDERQLQLGL